MVDIFDILGPIMVGPSSSHTAGAARIGAMARTLLGSRPVQAEIGLHGSFAETGPGHGTDRAEEQQHGVAPLPVPPGHQEIDRQQRRQKEKQEGKAAEYHGRRPAFQQNCPGNPRPALLRRNV